ncbi:MAG: hypothetical protein IPM39_06235 [Chloroflexi bacterium]|nr:hypothetical protein [Chloroflexota bacterium]
MKNLFVLTGLLALLVTILITAVPGAAAPAQQTNLLRNPGFEQPFGADGNAVDWNRWHQNSTEAQLANRDCTAGYYVLPKWGAETNSALIHSGGASQQVGNMFDTWHAGVWQNVPATPGTTYRFTFFARGRGSNDQFPAPSDTSLQMGVRAGIDPNGSGLWYESDVVWGAAASPHDQWQQVSVEATATGNQITVYTAANWVRAGTFQCRTHLDVWFDTAELVAQGPAATNTPPPQPTSPPVVVVPQATNTPVPPPPTDTPAVPATSTPIPTETPTETPPGATICVNAFNDENGNGVQDPNEGYMAGVTFTIANATAIVGQAISTGTETPVCQEGLPPDRYQIRQVLPPRLEPTTIDYADLEVQVGQPYGIAFGSRIRVEVTPTSEIAAVSPTPIGGQTDTDSSSSAGSPSGGISGLAIAGIAMLVTAVVLLGAVLFVLLRRQTG